jgi:hypothetical protein
VPSDSYSRGTISFTAATNLALAMDPASVTALVFWRTMIVPPLPSG